MMTKMVGAAVAELLAAAGAILEHCPPGEDRSIVVDKHLSQRLRDGHDGVIKLVKSHRRSAEQKLALNDFWDRIIRSRDHQLKLFDEKGNPLQTPATRAQMEQAKEGVDPKDGEQQTIAVEDEGSAVKDSVIEEVKDHAAVDNSRWVVNPGIPEHVELGLVRAIGQGMTAGKAVGLVATNTSLPKDTVMAYLEKLIEQGKVVKKGKSISLPEKVAPDITELIKQAARKAEKGTFSNNIILSIASSAGLGVHEVSARWDELMLSKHLFERGGYWFFQDIPGENPSPAAPAAPAAPAETTEAQKPDVKDLFEKIIFAVRQNATPNNRQAVLDWMVMETGQPEAELGELFDDLVFDDRLILGPDDQWTAPCRAEDLIKEKVKAGITHKQTIIESIAMQLEWQPQAVEDAWSRLQFSGVIKRGSGGWKIAEDPTPVAS